MKWEKKKTKYKKVSHQVTSGRCDSNHKIGLFLIMSE